MATHTNSETALGTTRWDLPPLILHPFADAAASSALVENSRAAMMAAGLLAPNGSTQDDIAQKLLEGRFCEIRMLYFVGKDLVRWIGQCQECADRIPELAGESVREQSFAVLVARRMPEAVSLKLRGWGVNDAGVIFSRAIALNHLFNRPPEFDQLAEEFIRNYHRYADHLFNCWLQMANFREITSANFHFDLYASGEYTKMLENEWGAG